METADRGATDARGPTVPAWSRLRTFDMHPLLHPKVSTFRERGERLRKGHAAAQTLRSVFPQVSLAKVHLRFLPATAPLHAAQSFVLYPGARAFFSYPCPYGDCDGIYDLSDAAHRALAADKCEVSGTLECCGLRSRDGLPRQACGLLVSYTITAQYADGSPQTEATDVDGTQV